MMSEHQEELNPDELFRPLAEVIRNAPPLEPLWGYFLFKKAITSIVGDPGVCKTTMGYGLAYALSRGEPFLDIKAEESVKVLYMDFESSDSLIASRTILVIGDEVKAPNFWIYNIVNYYLDKVADIIVDFCKDKGVNLIFIDNQSMAFNTRDENDNAEAIRQMRFIRKIANECAASVVVFHHTSKANLAGTRKGTGAFARARLADVCVNINALEEHKDIICMETVKNRMVDERVLWYIKKDEGKFTFTDQPISEMGEATDTKIYRTSQEILNIVNGDDKEYKHKELIELLVAKDYDKPSIENALRRLVQQRRLTRPIYGFYKKRS